MFSMIVPFFVCRVRTFAELLANSDRLLAGGEHHLRHPAAAAAVQDRLEMHPAGLGFLGER